jgi:hypothetical protein
MVSRTSAASPSDGGASPPKRLVVAHITFTDQQRDDGRLILAALLIEENADREPRNEVVFPEVWFLTMEDRINGEEEACSGREAASTRSTRLAGHKTGGAHASSKLTFQTDHWGRSLPQLGEIKGVSSSR